MCIHPQHNNLNHFHCQCLSDVPQEYGHVYAKQICLDSHRIYVVRPNACSLWEDQNEPSESDIEALKELVPVRKIQSVVVTDGMCLTELKILFTGGKIALTLTNLQRNIVED